jgi:signal transduction histidine kinase
MNAFVLLLTLFGVMTLGSASVLYFSFKGKVDASGKYFLGAESMIFLVIILVIFTNIDSKFQSTEILFITNFLNTASEVAVLLSLYSLSNNHHKIKFSILIVILVIFCTFIEYARINIDQNLPALLTALYSATMALITFVICKLPSNQDLKSNLFLRWIGYIEIGLFCVAAVRIGSYFAGVPIVPRQPTLPIALLYVLFISLSIFRYVFYQSLRISWVSPDANTTNPLNQNLANAIQEKNKLLEDLITSNRKIGIGALASSLAHQLSQPITGLSFQIHTAKHDLLNIQDAKNSIRILDKASIELEKLTNLVGGLRRLFGDKETQFEQINLIETCNTAIDFIEPTLQTNEITLIKNFSANPTIIGSPIQLQQVLINIFNNAIYSIANAQQHDRKITIDISHSDTCAIIRIIDSGPGIDQETLPEIFELYRTTKKEGLGVGLWLSKTIIEKHQGLIRASNSLNSGAIFEIEIPLVMRNEIRSKQ